LVQTKGLGSLFHSLIHLRTLSLSPFAGHVGCGVSDRGVVAVARGCGLQTRPG
jgi:hypothetical protein